MPRHPDLRTQRLHLRPFRPKDLDALLGYRNDPEVSRFDGPVQTTVEQARRLIDSQMAGAAIALDAWMQIAVARPDTGLIGDCGFRLDRHRPGTAEIGYRFARTVWGHGYAAEAVRGVLSWAFDACGVHRVIAYIDTRNTRSIALVERLGFRREGHLQQSFREPVGWSDEYLYAVLAREWAP
ncbi:MAG: GNAT family protein [Chloroflexota bacterium]